MSYLHRKHDEHTPVTERAYWIHADTKRNAKCSTISPAQDYIRNNQGRFIVSQKREKPDINEPTAGNNHGGENNPFSQWMQKEHTNRVEFWVQGPGNQSDLLQGLGIDLNIALAIQDTDGNIVYNCVLLDVNGASENVIKTRLGLCFVAYFTPSAEEVKENQKYNSIMSEDLGDRFVFTVHAKMYYRT